MTDFMTRLAARSVGSAEVVRPRIAPLFAPRARLVEEVREVEAEQQPPRPRVRRADTAAEPPAAIPERVVERAPPPPVPTAAQAPETEEHVREERVERVRDVVVEGVASAREPETIEAPQPSRREAEVAPAARPGRTIERHSHTRTVVRAAEPPAPPPETHESWLEAPPPAPERPVPPVAAAPAEPPVVRVTIGRVDVRAVLPQPDAPRTPPKRAPRMTLDEYLREGRRRT